MNTLTKRVMRLVVMTVGLAGLFVAVNAIPGAATPPVGFSSQLLGRGTYTSHQTLLLRQGMDIVVSKITVAPGGSSGWHSHPGGAIVVVQQGEITIYKSAGKGDDEQSQSQSDREGGGRFPHCVITKYTQGQAFSEGPGEVVDAVNTGSTDFVLFVTFPGVPVGGSSRIDQPNPGTCPV
jgi:hypothetical protein